MALRARILVAFVFFSQICFAQDVIQLTNTTNNLLVNLPPVSPDFLMTPTTLYLDLPVNTLSWSILFKKSGGCNNNDLNLYFNTRVPPCTLPSSAGATVSDLCNTPAFNTISTQTSYAPEDTQATYAGQRIYFGVGKTVASQASLICPFTVSVTVTTCDATTQTGFFDWNTQLAPECTTFINVSPLAPTTLSGESTFITKTVIPPNSGRFNISVLSNTSEISIYGDYFAGNQFNGPTDFALVTVNSQLYYILTLDSPPPGNFWISGGGQAGPAPFAITITIESTVCNATFGGVDCSTPITALNAVTSTTQGNLTAGSAQLFKPDLSLAIYQTITITATGGSIVAEASGNQYPNGENARIVANGGNFTWIFSATDGYANTPNYFSIRNNGTATVTYSLALWVNGSLPTSSSSSSSSMSSSSDVSSSSSDVSSSSSSSSIPSSSSSTMMSSSSVTRTSESSTTQTSADSSATSISSSIISLGLLFLAAVA